MKVVPRGRKPASTEQGEYVIKLLKISGLSLEETRRRMNKDIEVDVIIDEVRGLCAGQAHEVIRYLKRYCDAFIPLRGSRSKWGREYTKSPEWKEA